MKRIVKSAEPDELSAWKRKHPKKHLYADLTHVERQAINKANIQDQAGLCAYCCDRITEENSMNEHLLDRASDKKHQLDFHNIVASCTTPGQCDDAHKSQTLPLTPLMEECETELTYYLSGNVRGLTERAEQAIGILNLANAGLATKRKTLVEALIYEQGESPDQLNLLEEELLDILVGDLEQADPNGQLKPFSPVLVNILKKFTTQGA